jgi:hypothetical protein
VDDELLGEMLERETQTELDLAGSAERVDARPDAHTLHIVTLWSGPIYLAGGSRQQPV